MVTMTSSLQGQRIGNWLLGHKLGQGGMAEVYLGFHLFLPKVGAVKVLRPEYAHRKEILLRFQREAVSAGSLNHPNIINVEDFGKDEKQGFFMVMEYLIH